MWYDRGMASDPRIDAYIAKSADFARPILEHVRELVHKTIPGAGEAIKWGMPHFTHNDKSIAGMAAFKAHCAVMVHGDGRQDQRDGMGSYGKITALKDLPADADLAAKFIEARDRIDTEGTAVRRSPRAAPKPELPVPQDFEAALRENFRESALPVEGLGMHGGIADDTVSLADAVVQAGELFAVGGGFDPEAELADLDGRGIEVHPVEIVLEDLAVEVEEAGVAPQFLEARIGDFIVGVKLVEGFDEEGPAAAGRIEDAKSFEHFLPLLPEVDE